MILTLDIGGTNTRLALFDSKKKKNHPVFFRKYASSSWDSLPRLIENFLAEYHPSAKKNIRAGGIALAGPVEAAQVKLTNLNRKLDLNLIRQELAYIPELRFFNDLEALAHGLLVANPEDFCCLHPGSPGQEARLNKAILAPGTGLGEAFIISNQEIVPSEGGHSDFAPQSEAEVLLWRYLHHLFGHVSYERILSGPGMMNIYQFFQEKQQPLGEIELLDPATICQRALDKTCPLCEQSLDLFTRVLGAEAGNLALKTFALGGIYLGGGIPPKILPKLKDGTFLNSFQSKGRFASLMEKIPVFVILNESLPLLGVLSSLTKSNTKS